MHAKIESGQISEKQNLLIYPHNELVTIKGIEVHGEKKKQGLTGDICMLNLALDKKFDSTLISSGDVICDTKFPIKYVAKMECIIKVFEIDGKIFKGHRVIVHSHFAKISGKI